MSYLYSLEINPLWIVLFANIFSHSACCLLLLFLVSFTMQKLVSLIRSHLFILVFIFITLNCCWVTQSCLTLCDSMACSMPGFPVLHYLPEFTQTHVWMPSSVTHFSCPQSFPGSESFSVLFFRLFTSGDQSIGASASVLPMNIQDWFPLGLTDWSPCSRRDSQESSPAPQFESIKSLAFSLLYGPIIRSVRDYWKNHSFDYRDLCWQNNVSAF